MKNSSVAHASGLDNGEIERIAERLKERDDDEGRLTFTHMPKPVQELVSCIMCVCMHESERALPSL